MPATGEDGENGRVFVHRVFVHHRSVSFGDCDPAGIIFYPNFYRFFDEAVHALLHEIGWGWQRTSVEFGWLGLPLAAASARFLRPATHGETLRIETRAAGFPERRIVFAHRVHRAETLLCEGTEERFVGVRHPDDPDRVRAIDAPQALRDALTSGSTP